MSKGKLALTITAIVVAVVSLIPILWYVYIAFFGKTKEPSYVYNPSTLVKADGSEQNILELTYYKNKDKSGLEMFEVNFNSFFDESRRETKSQGLQFVAKDADTPLNWTMAWPSGYLSLKAIGKNNYYWVTKKIGYRKRFYASFGNWTVDSGESYNYSSSDNYLTTANDTDPLTSKSGLVITLEDEGQPETFLLGFKGRYFEVEGQKIFPDENGQYNTVNGKNNWYPALNDFGATSNFVNRVREGLNGDHTDYIDCFYEFDPYWLAHDLYTAVQTMQAGTEQYFTFTWGDQFDFKKYDEETRVYKQVESAEVLKVKNRVKTNVSIKVNIYDNGATKASDSMFKVIKGDPTYNLNGDKVYTDYFYGDSIIELTLADFDLINVSENNYALKLSNSAYSFYKNYAKTCALSICIDLDIFQKKGYTFVGFSKDSHLDEFTIYEIYTLKTQGDEKVREEVLYAQSIT